jgi:hypothetical protein
MGEYGMLGDRGLPVRIVMRNEQSCRWFFFQGDAGQPGFPGPVGRIGKKVDLYV